MPRKHIAEVQNFHGLRAAEIIGTPNATFLRTYVRAQSDSDVNSMLETTAISSRAPEAMQRTSAAAALRAHWPEYLIEAFALGMFMISAGLFTTLFDAPDSSISRSIGNSDVQRVLIGIAMGLTAIALIYSPWGQRSGAHMNPAVTLTFLRLGHVSRWDAVFYIVAQFAGGTVGVLVIRQSLCEAFANPPVRYIVTVPGVYGASVAFAAELVISFVMMAMILRVSSSPQFMRLTGLFAGGLVAAWISIEAPLSGMSMNPARTFASAAPSGVWTSFWIYVAAPILGMQLAASAHIWRCGRASIMCAKLLHTSTQRCIHCGFEPLWSHPPKSALHSHESARHSRFRESDGAAKQLGRRNEEARLDARE